MTDAKRALNEELWLAAKEGDVAKVKEKHEAGADVNWRHPWEPPGRLGQFAALHIASDQGHMEVCKYLVEKAHADLKNSGAYGETAFEHINGRTGNGREAIASYLKMKTYACQALDAFANALLSCPLLTSVDRTVGFLPAALCKLHWLCKSSSRCSQSPRVARRPSESTGYLDSSVTHESQSAQCCGQMRRVALDGPMDGSRTPRAYLGLDRAPLRERAHLFCVLICQFDIRSVCVFVPVCVFASGHLAVPPGVLGRFPLSRRAGTSAGYTVPHYLPRSHPTAFHSSYGVPRSRAEDTHEDTYHSSLPRYTP